MSSADAVLWHGRGCVSSGSGGREGVTLRKVMTSAALSRPLAKIDGRTCHGLRSTFRDWCAAQEPRVECEIAELCLAHKIGSAVEQASGARCSTRGG